MIYVLEDDASIQKLVVYTLNSQGMEARGFDRPSQFWSALALESRSWCCWTSCCPRRTACRC